MKTEHTSKPKHAKFPRQITTVAKIRSGDDMAARHESEMHRNWLHRAARQAPNANDIQPAVCHQRTPSSDATVNWTDFTDMDHDGMSLADMAFQMDE